MTPLVEVTGGPGVPNTLVIASASARSLSSVEVPWAFMWPTCRGLDAGIFHGELHASRRSGPAGRRGGDVERVGGGCGTGDLGVDVGTAVACLLELFEHERSRSFADDEAVAPHVEWSGHSARGRGRHVRERRNADPGDGGFGACPPIATSQRPDATSRAAAPMA